MNDEANLKLRLVLRCLEKGNRRTRLGKEQQLVNVAMFLALAGWAIALTYAIRTVLQ